MKTDELRKLIRQLVKEEVASEVSKAMGKVLVEMVREIKVGNGPILKERKEYIGKEVEERPPQYNNGPVLKTNNPKLSAALAATAQNFKPLKKTPDSHASLAAMLEGDFEKIGKGENAGVDGAPATKIDFLKSIITENTNSQPSVLDGGENVPDMLQQVFKKDFRAVMRKIDEKKKTGGSGMINASSVLSG